MNIKKNSFLILLLIISSIFFYVRNYKIKEGKRGRKWGRRAGRFAKRAGRSIRRAGKSAARAAQRNAAAQAARREAAKAARNRQVRAMRRAAAKAARRRARQLARAARAVTKMNNKYSRIQSYCSSNGFNCYSGDYTLSKNIRENKCRKSIRNLKKFCNTNIHIHDQIKCKRVNRRKWRRKQIANLPRPYDYACTSTTTVNTN